MELSIRELSKDALTMPDKQGARHFAHDMYEILHRTQLLENVLHCIHAADDSNTETLAGAAEFSRLALARINGTFNELIEALENCNNLAFHQGANWRNEIER